MKTSSSSFHPSPVMHRIFFVLILLILNVSVTFGDSFLPVISSYGPSQYNSGLQNWSVTQDYRGVVYVGNNRGMLSFDGYTWTCTPLPGNTIVRSLLADGKRIYAGSYEEFGYFERDDYGQWRYHSLWYLVGKYKSHNDEIWKIIKLSNGHIIFQSFCSWFEFDGRKVSVHYQPDSLPLYFFKCRGKIYAQLIGKGLYVLSGSHYFPVVERQKVGNDDIVSMLDWNGKIILCTASHGLFILNGQKTIPFQTNADNILRKSELNRAVISRDRKSLILGTILDGVMGIDRTGRMMWHFNTKNMLRNNTVLDLFSDNHGNIWAALDNGISLIRQGSQFSLLRCPYGMVYDLYQENYGIFIATNQNTLFYDGSSFFPISGTQGQNWHISRLGDDLIAGNNHGTRLLQGLVSSPVEGSSAASSTSIHRFTVTDDKDYLIESSYAELRVYRRIGQRWTFYTNVSGFSAPVRQLEIDRHGVIWAANMNKGFYKIELSGDMRRTMSVKYYPSVPGTRGGDFFHVMKINGDVVLSHGKNLYLAEAGMKHITSLDKQIDADVESSTIVDSRHFWLSTLKGYELYSVVEKSAKESYRKLLDVPATLFGLDCSDNQNTVRVFGRYAYFCMNEGVGRMDMKDIEKGISLKSKLNLDRAWYTSPSGEVSFLNITQSDPKIGGDLTLRFNFANYDNAAIKFVFILEGGGLHTTTSSAVPIMHYSSLPYGSFKLTCEARDALGNVIDSKSLMFSHPLPWWGSAPMIILYCLLIGCIIYFFAKWKAKNVLKRQMRKMEAERMRQELELSEKQRIIEMQQKQILEQQLQDKGKEIASLAMDNVIDKNGRNSENWKLFQENFDLIHKQFFRHLREKYPILTATDLKFCAYLRLNLTTKEIAEITGLSVRGVEGARYRLRKKFGLKENDDLVSFLVDFK